MSDKLFTPVDAIPRGRVPQSTYVKVLQRFLDSGIQLAKLNTDEMKREFGITAKTRNVQMALKRVSSSNRQVIGKVRATYRNFRVDGNPKNRVSELYLLRLAPEE